MKPIIHQLAAMCRIMRGTYVGVVQYGAEDPVYDKEAGEDLDLRPPGHHQRAADPRDLGPVERQDAHPQPARDTEQLVDHDILRLDPADIRERRQRREQVACTKLMLAHT